MTEVKKNTAYNEIIDADNPQTPSEVRYQGQGRVALRGKIQGWGKSTVDSLDEEEDDEEIFWTEVKKNTAYYEIIDADNPQTPSEVRLPGGGVERYRE